MTIGQRWERDAKFASGFDYMRVILAAAVLVWHSCQFTYGTEFAKSVWLSPVGMVVELILPMFFSLSGFLVTSSLERSGGLVEFLSLRAIRIYPALVVEVLLSAFILGPFVTVVGMKAYFSNYEFFSYLANVTGWIHFRLPGVFLSNPVPGIVNSSLWTVPFELECYILISVLFLLGYMRSLLVAGLSYILCSIFVLVWLSVTQQSGTPPGGVNGRVLVLCFLAGSIIFRFRDRIAYHWALSVFGLASAFIAFRFDLAAVVGPIFIAYTTVWLGMLKPRRTIVVTSGDYSYGTYLYAGPIQQTVAWGLAGSNSYFLNVALSLPLVVCFALFSWHAIEKPCLRVKRYIRGKGPSRAAVAVAAPATNPGPI